MVRLYGALEKDNFMLFLLRFRIPTGYIFSTLVYEAAHSAYLEPPDNLILLIGQHVPPVFPTSTSPQLILINVLPAW